jgi:hypothetical protein
MSWARVLEAASPLGVAALALAASRADAVCRIVPVLGVLRGPLGAALAATAGILVLARLDVFRWRAERVQAGPGMLFAVGAVLLTAAGLSYASRLRVSGDEPHYLLMAQSLWRDHDLDLANNFDEAQYLEYTPGPLRPHYGAPRRDGRPYPAHSPGLPLLLAPVYAAFGRLGCVAVLAACAAAAAARTYELTRRLGGTVTAGYWAWAAALGPPLFFYSFHVYTEAPSALATVVALEALLAPAPTVLAALGAALLASVLPWLHVKMAFAAAALGVVALVRLRGRPRAAFFLAAVGAAALYGLHYQAAFGSPTPLALYGGLPADVSGAPGRALGGLLLDRSFGLLPHAPLLLLAFPGLVALAARARMVWPALLVGLAVLAPVLFWRMWWGGQCPPGRFLVPLVPVLAVAVGLAAAGTPRGLARWRLGLLGAGAALGFFMTFDPGALLLLNRGSRPTRVWAALSGDVPIDRYLPSLTLADPVEARVAVVWGAALLALFAIHRLARSSEKANRAFGGLLLPLLLFLAIGVGVDGWARAQPGTPVKAVPSTAGEDGAGEGP